MHRLAALHILKSNSYLLPLLVWTMEVWRKNELRHFVQASLGRLVYCCDWCQSLHEATVLLLDAICGISANPLYEGNGLDRLPCFEKHHWPKIISCEYRPMVLLSSQHCVSSLTDVNSGSAAGVRISLSSFFISASISRSSSSEPPSSAVPVVWSTPYNLEAYYVRVSGG
jgi:hypothetical protein